MRTSSKIYGLSVLIAGFAALPGEARAQTSAGYCDSIQAALRADFDARVAPYEGPLERAARETASRFNRISLGLSTSDWDLLRAFTRGQYANVAHVRATIEGALVFCTFNPSPANAHASLEALVESYDELARLRDARCRSARATQRG